MDRKRRFREGVQRLVLKLGHVQAQVLLTALFFVVITPYGLMLRLVSPRRRTAGWKRVDSLSLDLQHLRRLF